MGKRTDYMMWEVDPEARLFLSDFSSLSRRGPELVDSGARGAVSMEPIWYTCIAIRLRRIYSDLDGALFWKKNFTAWLSLTLFVDIVRDLLLDPISAATLLLDTISAATKSRFGLQIFAVN